MRQILRVRAGMTTGLGVTTGLRDPRRGLSTASREIDVSFRTADQEHSRFCRNLRKEFKIPGLIYGAGKGVFPFCQTRKAITMSMFDVQRHWKQLGRSIENTLFTVRVDDGTSYLAVPRQLQAHPISENPLSLNFLIYKPGAELRIPVRFINQEDCIEIKRGAFLVPVNHYVSVAVEDGVDVPAAFNIDVTEAGKNKVFTIKDITFPDGVQVHKKFRKDSPLCVLKSAAKA